MTPAIYFSLSDSHLYVTGLMVTFACLYEWPLVHSSSTKTRMAGEHPHQSTKLKDVPKVDRAGITVRLYEFHVIHTFYELR